MWINHIVLIVCKGGLAHQANYAPIRYLLHGWGTGHYWLDKPKMKDYLQIKREHPEYGKDEVIFCGLCDWCKKKLLQ